MAKIEVDAHSVSNSRQFFYTTDKSGIYYKYGAHWVIFGLGSGSIFVLHGEPEYLGEPLHIGDTITITVTE